MRLGLGPRECVIDLVSLWYRLKGGTHCTYAMLCKHEEWQFVNLQLQTPENFFLITVVVWTLSVILYKVRQKLYTHLYVYIYNMYNKGLGQ